MERHPAGRRIPRPARVAPCVACGAVAGFNYGSCPACTAAIEGLWEADWETLLEQEEIAPGSDDERLLAEVVLAELDNHLWTVADMAMRRLRCPACGAELGGGPPGCAECTFAFGNLWWHDIEAGRQGVMTMNEHALRVGRYVIRHPHRHSAVVAEGWRLNMPRILVGWLPPGEDARRYANLRKAGVRLDWDAIYRAIDAEINGEAREPNKKR